MLLALWMVRAAWESERGLFPVRWGGFFSVILVIMFAVGLMIEISVATNPVHSLNQPGRQFETS